MTQSQAVKPKTHKGVDMINGPLLSGIIRFAIPVMLTSIIQLFFNMADMAVLGRFCGNDAYASVGATSQLTTLLINVFIGIATGCGVAVSHAVGAKDKDTVGKTVHTGILTAIIIGSVITVVGIVFSPIFLRWMDTPPEIIDRSVTYIRIYFAAAVPIMVYNFSAAILRAVGDAKRPMYYGMLAGTLNLCLNLVFVLVFHMDVAGVALATALSNCLSCFLAVRNLMHREDSCRLFLSHLAIHKPALVKIIKIGLPTGIQSGLFSISNVTIQSSINGFGKVAIAGNSAAASWETIIWQAMNGFFQATLTFTGQNVGARNYRRIRKTAYISLACSVTVGAVLGVVARIFGPHLLSVYITDSPESIEKGLIRMSTVCILYFINGFMNIPSYGLRGMGYSIVPMAISVFGICGIRLIWIYTVFPIPQYHTLQSLYFTYPLTWIVTAIGHWTMYFIVSRKIINKMREQERLNT